jgi:hypothetical protein
VYRLKGELLLQAVPAHQEEAEEHFHQALASARRRQAKSWELRAAMSLSRLWQSRASAPRPTSYSLRPMASAPRALTRQTCKKPEHCWPSCAQRRCLHRQHDSPVFLH